MKHRLGSINRAVFSCSLLVGLALYRLVLGAAPSKETKITIRVLSGVSGNVEPCGCTSKPLGGLDKIAAIMEAQPASDRNLVVVGDTFFVDPLPQQHKLVQELNRAQLIGDILSRLNPLAWVLGHADVKAQAEFQEFGQKNKVTIVPKAFGASHLPEFGLSTISGLKIGWVATKPMISHADVAQVAEQARVLKEQGAVFVIALVPQSARAAEPLVGLLDDVHIALVGGSDNADLPKVSGSTYWVAAGDKGRFLGELTLHFRGTSIWQYFDEGQEEKNGLHVRLQRLRQEAASLEDGPVKVARQQKIVELEKEWSVPIDPPAYGSFFTWRVLPIEKKLPGAVWAQTRMREYNTSLCDVALRTSSERTCSPPPQAGDRYVGSAECQVCHSEAYEVWQKTKHALAMTTLNKAGKQCDWGCIACHTVGFERPGGFCRLQDIKPFENVGCENCHGPGGQHVANPENKSLWGGRFSPKAGAEVCATCHTTEHSDLFNFETYLPKILGPGHGAQPIKTNRQ